MNAAAAKNRTRHDILDSHITNLLPQALPPHASTPALFTLGILPFARLFFELEKLWLSLLTHQYADPRRDAIRAALVRGLREETFPRIERSKRFKNDVGHLRWLSARLARNAQSASGSNEKSPDGRAASPVTILADGILQKQCDACFDPRRSSAVSFDDTPTLDALLRRIHATRERPHLFIAHVYVWYMAVLSGGRYLHRTLRDVEPKFWGHASQDDEAGYSFLVADLDAKPYLKARLAEWDALLSEGERAEVVAETEVIYDMTIKLVNRLEAELPCIMGGVYRDELCEGLGLAGKEEEEERRRAALRGAKLSQGVDVPWFGRGLQQWLRWLKGVVTVTCLVAILVRLMSGW